MKSAGEAAGVATGETPADALPIVRSDPGTPTLAGWGMVPMPGVERPDEDLARVTRDVPLTRGLGRSYGDASLPAAGDRWVASSVLADRILGFDPETRILQAEAGLSLAALNRVFLPRGYFPPVTPGTQFVTLGGAVASDVHGKNHHVAGCFGDHVTRLRMRVASGEIVDCGPDLREDLFRATVGGMGLTGHILEVDVRLDRVPSPWIVQESERIPDIDAFIRALKASADGWPFTMGWIDCLSGGARTGRGILMRGRWAEPHEAPARFPKPKRRIAVPFTMPSMLLNPLTVAAFNELYYWRHLPRLRRGIVHPESFFYPLDAILKWNRLYGPRGFTQYQCVIPDDGTNGLARRFLDRLRTLGGSSSFLCVIKDCGPEGRGLLSFPMRGISIALDIAMGHSTSRIVDALNALVIEMGGRIYLTKDLLTRAEDYRRMDPRLPAFEAVRRQWDPDGRFRSALSARVLDRRGDGGGIEAGASGGERG